MTLEQLRARMEAAKAQADALMAEATDGELTEEQQKQFDGCMADFDKAKKAYDNAVKLAAADEAFSSTPVPQPAARLEQPGEPHNAPQEPTGGQPFNPALITGGWRHKPLTNWTVPITLEDGRTFQPEEAAYRAGSWFRGICFGDASALDWCRSNGVGKPYADLSVGTNSAGGVLVPEEFAATVIALTSQFGVARANCRIETMQRDTKTVPKVSTFVTAAALGEGAAYTDTDPAFQPLSLVARKWGCMVQASEELVDDSAVDIANTLAEQFARAFAYAEDDALWNGDGTSTYHGIYGILGQFDANESWVGVHTATAGDDTFSEFLLEDIQLAQAAVNAYGISGDTAHYCSYAFKAGVLSRLAHAGGGTSAVTIQNGIMQWDGWPLRLSERMPSGITTDYSENGVYVFGDLRRAAIFGDRQEIRTQTLVERYSDTGQIGFKANERFDINAHDLGDGTNPGAVSCLMGD